MDETDHIAAEVIKELMAKEEDPEAVGQFKGITDHKWVCPDETRSEELSR